jgi:hypothetical protein
MQLQFSSEIQLQLAAPHFRHETLEVKKAPILVVFQTFFVIFSPISSFPHMYYTNSEDKSAIT